MTARLRPRVLVISADVVGPSMAGVGIRSTEFARVLSGHADVTLAAIPGSENPLPGRVRFLTYEHPSPSALKPEIFAADVIVSQPTWPQVMGWFTASGARLVFDMYVPEIFEVLESWGDANPALREMVASMVIDRAMQAFHVGHHFLCASEKQKDMWIGAMMSERLVRFGAYARDTSFESVIAVVPFGIPPDPPPPPAGDVLRATFPVIGAGDPVALWNGGLWGWLDPATAIRAIAAVRDRHPGARLVFMGAARHRPAIKATEEARALAAELGVLDTHALFNTEWVPYETRGDWLLAADCAVSCHAEHLETRFAFRTRMLDCFWAGLPIVCTRGDALADVVERERLGGTVPERDPDALADALADVFSRGRDAFRDPLDRVAEAHRWPTVCAPLVDFATSSVPPVRLGGGMLARAAVRPGQRARSIGYQLARKGLNRVGLKNWPLQGSQ